MADATQTSPTPEELAQLLARYKDSMANITTPVAPLAPGAGVLAPPPTSVPSTSPTGDSELSEEDKEDDTAAPAPVKPASDVESAPENPAPSDEDNSKLLSMLSQSSPTPSTSPSITDKLNQAQLLSSIGRGVAGLSQAGNLIGSGLAATGGAQVKPLPQEMFNKEEEQANQPFENLKQQLAVQGDDPNSEVSKAAQAYAAKLGINLPGPVSANTIFKVLPIQEKLLANKETAQARRDVAQQHTESTAATRDLAAATREANTKQKATDKQNKSLESTQTLLESARGNPAAAQAEKDLYSAQKANSLANLYGDPNKLSLPQVKLLASEIGKIAAGGSSTQSELEGIMPNTLVGKMSSFTTNLTNNPTPANAAAFVKQYQDYTKALTKDAKKIIQDKYGRVIEARRGNLGDENYQSLKDQYINRFNTPDEDSSAKGNAKFDPSSQADIAAVTTIMKNNPGTSQSDAIQALVKHKTDQGY